MKKAKAIRAEKKMKQPKAIRAELDASLQVEISMICKYVTVVKSRCFLWQDM